MRCRGALEQTRVVPITRCKLSSPNPNPRIKTLTRKERDVTGKLRLFASTSAVCSDRTLSKPNAIRQLSKLVFSYKITQHRRDVEQTEEGT